MNPRSEATVQQLLETTSHGSAFLDAVRSAREIEGTIASAPSINRVAGRLQNTRLALRQDSGLLDQLRDAQASSVDRDELLLAAYVLEPPVLELWRTRSDLLDDPTVALADSEVRTEVALFLVEEAQGGPHEGESPTSVEDSPRYLSRFGGSPIASAHDPAPVVPLVVQLDLKELSEHLDPLVDERWRAMDLARDGVLQVFASGLQDSRTAAEAAGGGVTVRHLDESSLLEATITVRDCDVFDPVWIETEPGLTFAALEALSDAGLERLVALEQATYATAAMHHPTRFQLEQADTPRLLSVPPRRHVSHLLGVPSIEYPLDPQDRQLLESALPLVAPGDSHVLLVAVRGTGTLETAFGDEGWLQVWMRAHDLAARRFEHIVSFVKSA